MRCPFRAEFPGNTQKDVIWFWVVDLARNWYSEEISFAAPTKLDPLSENISDGFPLRAMNRRRDAINASVVKSETTSKCTAFTVKDTKTHM